MGPRLLLIPVPQGSPALRPQQNLQLAPGKKVILQPLRNPGGVNLYRHPNGQIIQLVPLQQLQPAGPQPSLPPIVLRNPGSVVGIGLPGPSKLPETPICQSTSVSSPIPTTTVTSALPGSPSTLSTPATTETSSGLSTCSSALSTPPTTDSPSMMPVPRITDTLSTSPLYPTTEATSTLLSSPTTKGLSTSPLPSAINQTIRSVLMPPISTAQATPTVSPVPVAVSQGGVLTLRISPSGVRNIATHTSSDSKTTYSTIGQPNSTPSLISLQSGSFALLQVPGQKNIPNSIVKQVSSLENTNQKNELSAIKLQEENSCLREVAALPLAVTMSDNKTKENVLPANQPESRSEITYDRNATTSETTEENAETLDHLSSRTPIFQSDVVSSDHSYISEKEKCAKHPESIPAEVPYTTETVHEGCSQIAVLAQDALQERKVAMPLKSSGEEQAYSVQTQSPTADLEEAEQMKFATEEGGVVEQSQKQWDKEEVHINCTEKLQEKVKSSQWENQDLEQLERNRKGKDDSVAAERDQQVVRGNPKVNNAKNENNTLGNKYVDGTQEFLHERNNHSQENYDVSSLKEGTTGIQEDNQTVKGSLVQVSQTWNKISKQSVFSENKSSMGTAEHVEKFAKCIEQDILKSNNHIKDPVPIIDITMDDKEKDEKTDDSADDMVDEVSGCQSEDIVNVETLNGSESSEVEETVDIETVEELSEKINIARLKATAAHALLSKQLHLVRDHSSKAMTKTKQSEPSNKKPKDEEEAFANYRQTHTANERRRRKEMRGLFEKLKAALGLHSLPKVSKCFILKQAFEEIQGLTDQADKLTGQKNLLMRKQDTLIRKVSALSGKTQEVVLKKLEYIYAKQKAVEAQKKQQQAEPMKIIETAETARPPVESSPSLFESSLMKPAVMSNQRTKPLILSRKGSRATGEPPSPVAVTNASLVMTAQGQVLAFKSPLMPGQVAALPSTLLQAELKSEVDSSSGITQPGIASVMIQLPGSTVPMQMKGIIPNSTIPIALSPVASSRASPAAESASELPSETEDTFMMPRIVNVTSLATEEDRSLNLDVSRDSYTASHANSQISEPSMQAALKETTDSQSEEKAKTTCGKGRDANRTAQDFLGRNSFPQIVNVSSLKGSPESFATKLCIEELAGGQTEEKQVSKGGDRQKAKDFSFQKLQAKEPKDSGIEMELTKVASAMHEAELDESELMDIEESDDTDETLTSLLNEIAFLNQQLNDDASDIPELPNSLSSGFSLGGMECHRKSATADRSPFPFGALSGSFKDLSVVQESGDSISPLLLHLDDDDLPDGNRNLRELSSESDTLKIMQSSEVKDSNPDYSALNSDGSGENKEALAKTRSMSPPVLQMKTNVETGNTDTTWRPMPKLAPLGLKTANLPLEPEGQNTKAMPLLAPVAAKEIPVQPVISPNQDTKAMPTLVPVVTKSK